MIKFNTICQSATSRLQKYLLLLFLVLALYLTTQNTLSSQDLGNGFFDHGVAAPVSNHRGVVAATDGNGRNVVLLWLFDHRGGYGLLMIDAETGRSEQFDMPFPAGDAVYTSILSSKNKFYTHFNSNFAEFDPVKRAFTFTAKSSPQMAMGMTEDDHGIIWAVTYPKSGVISFNPETKELKDYGYVYKQNWNQYQRSVATDDKGWLYFAIGNTASQIIAFNPPTGETKPMLPEQERKRGPAFVYRNTNGKVYGQPLQGNDDKNWYEFYNGKGRKTGRHTRLSPKPYITGSQSLFHQVFPDGTRIKSLDLLERKLVTEDPKNGSERTVSFQYQSEGAWVMGVAVSPDGTIAGGTTFPMRFFNYDPKTDKIIHKEAFGQFDALACHGDRLYFGVYPSGALLEWDPSKPWINTIKGQNTNPLFLAAASLAIHRPHRVLGCPDGKTVIMSGTPEYGYTGGGLLFWDREKKSHELLVDSAVILDQSTMSMIALPGDKMLGGTTTSPGTGGEKKAKEALLYIMDIPSRKVEWQQVLIPEAQVYSDLHLAKNGLVFGVTDRKIFFVFDPVKREIIYREDAAEKFGPGTAKESPRIFITGPDGETYLLFRKGIVKPEKDSFRLTMIAESPVPVDTGGDYLDGRIYFVSGSHLCSYKF